MSCRLPFLRLCIRSHSSIRFFINELKGIYYESGWKRKSYSLGLTLLFGLNETELGS